MLKQGVKTIDPEFILTSVLSQLSFVQFRPYATQFPGFLTLTLLSKSKKTLRQVCTIHLHSRPPLMQGSRVLFGMWVLWKIDVIVLSKELWQKKMSVTHTFCSLDCNFFLQGLFTSLMTSKGKTRIYKVASKQSKQSLLLFYFFGLKD